MYTFVVNGKTVKTDKKQSLLRFLRDELHMTSVKDGCSQGACGACTVIIDGVTCKACVPTTDRLEGKHVLTVEGLSEWESQVFTYAYGEAGAVQCGFCIPGMVMCTKALLDVNPDPTEDEIKYALRNNYCRCTGYVKIIAAVKLSAKILREGRTPEKSADDWKVGSRVHRLDVEEKVLGYGKYPDDFYKENMCYGSALRSKYPRARVLSIDTSKAKALPGVAAVLTAEDIPGENKIGHLKHDQYTLIPVGGLTHYLGDAVALVAAEDMETVEKAKKLIKVEYEVLPMVHNIKEAAAADAPKVFDEEESNVQAYKHVSRGNAAEAIRNAKHVITQHFETPWTEHAFLEPECAVAYIDEDGDVMVISTDQDAYCTYRECSLMLGTDKVKAENALVGGGFGGKEDMTVQHHAALLAHHTRRPVKVRLTRAESLLIHPKRHHFVMNFTMGCDENGKILGVKAKVASDTGAFASLGGPVLERACTHAAGPYAYENFEIEGTAYYTNNPPAGAFRGFGVTQTCFATETLLNMMADEIGITPWEIRYRNAIRPGGVLPNGQIVDESTGLVETLEAVKEQYDSARAAGKPIGLACAMKNAGVGVGIPDTGRVKLIIEEDHKLHIYAGASCIGQGLGTVLVQMVVSSTDLKRGDIVYERSNTWIAPDSGTTSGSRQTLITGEACMRACRKLMEAKTDGKTLADLEGQEFYGEYLAKTDPLGADVPNPVSHVAYGYATQMCILDAKTGKIEKMVAAHDVGKAVNPLSCEGQIEGGVVMSMGFALREKYPIDENCKPIEKFGALGLFRAHEIPEIEAIVIDKPGLDVAYGAIGIGEITSIPTAPAITDAYYRLDGERRYSLPISGTPYNKEG
ncbi:selenium-dependent xanthine dehydrogenase [Schaedlerella sp.]|jgi:aldehyde oxidoreductase|uniref:selenium-dependent xanthine dehydrogenase n=1 Tax=Schaedlerella sp. TaxID=2676057 RepID=UPI0013634604|nr:selenium-dependent xanthine dehydrogenase [uncultured Schaedlerella sp.]MCI8767401.1 selenium-dependent xanthine dehydrogenase [Ruminococcus sp.]MCI9328758.1 selenium-dependent xanthine dehydrogenase [Ruminococcus sp.]NBJ00606.1 selenium-dependent xanthine dehydrogenase [Lachnospiraceae bacterium]